MNMRYCFRSEAEITIFDQEMFRSSPIFEGLFNDWRLISLFTSD